MEGGGGEQQSEEEGGKKEGGGGRKGVVGGKHALGEGGGEGRALKLSQNEGLLGSFEATWCIVWTTLTGWLTYI